MEAQNDFEKMPPKRLKKSVENALQVKDIYSAINYLEVYTEKMPADFQAKYQLAELHRDVRNYDRALELFEEVYNLDNETFVEAKFYWAQILKMQGNYEKALTLFEEFQSEYRGRELRRWASFEAEGCEMALEIDTVRNIDVVHLDKSINSGFVESSPTYLDMNTIFYSSLPSDTLVYMIRSERETKIPYRRLYQATRKSDIQWKSDGPLDYPFNEDEAHYTNPVVSMDRKRLFFSKCEVDWQNKTLCRIYISYKDSLGMWGEPEDLGEPVNMEGYTSTMPALGMHAQRGRYREILYFVSDRPIRSVGGMDMWYSVFEPRDSSFARVDNCGRRVNSPGDEITPFFDQTSQILYFSSNYHPGYGGFDIFRARGSQRRFKNPENLGKPINSSYDDIDFVLNVKQKEEGLFVSNRTGVKSLRNENCCDDIFSFYDKDYISLGVRGKVNNILQEEDAEITPMEDAIAMLFMIGIDEDTGEEDLVFITSDTTSEDGYYFIELEKDIDYKIMYRKDGYFYNAQEFSTKNYNRSDTLQLPDVDLEEIPNKPIVFYIYYGTDQHTLTPEAKKTIDTTMYSIMSQTPDIIVEISSHTDSVGSSEYNQLLSQRRADAVVKYLTEKGIDSDRLIAKGYGEKRPIVSNKTEEGRALNRRTEFSVVGSLDPFSKLNVSGLKIIRTKKFQETLKKEETEE